MNKTEITKHLKLPFQFDEAQLVKDLNLILDSKWTAHFNERDYEGKWTSIALYAPGGDANNIYALSSSDSQNIEETAIMAKCNYFKVVLSEFQCPLLSVRLLNLGKGANIKPHQDYNLGYENDCFRLHIPIATNPQVKFTLDGKQLQMNPGECWYTNVNYTHSVSNNGQTDRIHLVIDGQRNEWSDRLFFSLVGKESLLYNATETYDKATFDRIVEELERLKPPGYESLIKTFTKEQLGSNK